MPPERIPKGWVWGMQGDGKGDMAELGDIQGKSPQTPELGIPRYGMSST